MTFTSPLNLSLAVVLTATFIQLNNTQKINSKKFLDKKVVELSVNGRMNRIRRDQFED
jgi:hypothetical protein